MLSKGTRQSPVYPMIVKLVVLSNAVSFFGKELGKRWWHQDPVVHLRTALTISAAKNEAFMESALRYIEETIICAEILRLSPKCMAP